MSPFCPASRRGALITLANRNPSGITFGYTSLDPLLLVLSKLSTILLDEHLLAVDDVDAFLFSALTTLVGRNPRGITFSDATRDLLLQVLSKLSPFTFLPCKSWIALITLANRNPSGITFGYTSLDPLLLVLSKLSTILLDEHLFAVDDVDTFQFSAFTFHFSALQVVDSFDIFVFSFHLFYCCAEVVALD